MLISFFLEREDTHQHSLATTGLQARGYNTRNSLKSKVKREIVEFIFSLIDMKFFSFFFIYSSARYEGSLRFGKEREQVQNLLESEFSRNKVLICRTTSHSTNGFEQKVNLNLLIQRSLSYTRSKVGAKSLKKAKLNRFEYNWQMKKGVF